MKKTLAPILFFMFSMSLYALPMNNPSEASLYTNGMCWKKDSCDPCFSWLNAFSFRIGFYGDYVFNRYLERDDEFNMDADIDTTKIFTNASYLVLNFCDRVDLFTTLGATHIHLFSDGDVIVPATTGPLAVEMDFVTTFSWSVGGRVTLWQCDCLAVGIEGEYFRTNPDPDVAFAYSTGQLIYFDGSTSSYREWQVGLGASYRFQLSCPPVALIPYMGVKWAGSQFSMNLVSDEFPPGTPTGPEFKANKLWGYVLGTTLTLCDMIGVTVEGRWGDEKAAHVKGQFRF